MDTIALLRKAYKVLSECPVPREGSDFGPAYEKAVADREEVLNELRRKANSLALGRKLTIK